MLLSFTPAAKATKPAPQGEMEFASEVEFVPYTTHYNPHTILTKNGELLQIIKLTSQAGGVQHEGQESTQLLLRDAIRDALVNVIEDDSFAFWIHTHRKPSPIIPHHKNASEPLAQYAQDRWQETNHWHNSYVNEVYVTLLKEGQSANLFDMNDFREGFRPTLNRHYRERYLNAASADLEKKTNALLQRLQVHFDARRLSMVERAVDEKTSWQDSTQTTNAYYSEMMEFLGLLVNLSPQPMMMLNADLSQMLGKSELIFGFNVLESKRSRTERKFGSVLTLKAYKELSPEAFDQVLQQPREMIVSQSFSFLPKEQALEYAEQQRTILETSQDTYFVQASGLFDMLGSDLGRPVDYVKQQINVLVMEDTLPALDASAAAVQEGFAQIGMVAVREDLRMEEAFWSILPGNFEFTQRSRPLAAQRIGGMARLNYFPTGNATDTHWGDYVALLNTTHATPYYFNFHHRDIGHTAILDYNAFADSEGVSLMHFLLLHTRKFGGRLIIFDQDHQAKLLTEALGGRYTEIFSHDKYDGYRPAMGLNPLHLPDSKSNRAFVTAWLASLAQLPTQDEVVLRNTLRPLVDELFAAPPVSRSITHIAARLRPDMPHVSEAFDRWSQEPARARLFDAPQDQLDLTAGVQAFSMHHVAAQPHAMIPVFGYLFHRLLTELDGRPTVIVFNEAWKLFDHPFFAPRMGSIMQRLTLLNAMGVFYTRNPEEYTQSALTKTLIQECPTRIYLPDDIASNYYGDVFGLSDSEMRALLRMERKRGNCLIKHGQDVVRATIPMDKLADIRAICANDLKSLRNAGGPFS